MSYKKNFSVDQLLQERKKVNAEIGVLTRALNNTQTELVWINKYIEEKTPVTISVREIEDKLGYKINLLPSF